MKLDAQRYADHLELARRGSSGGLLKRGTRYKGATKALQEKLSQLGYAVEVDGLYGRETEEAVRAFQQSRGARVDGVVGKETLGKLLRAKARDPNDADTSIDSVKRVVGEGESLPSRRTSGLGRARAAQRGGDSASTGRAGGTGGRGARSAKREKGSHGGFIDPVTGAETATAATGPIGSTDPKEHQITNPEFEKLHPRDQGKFAKKGDSGESVSNTQSALNQVNDAKLKTDGQFGDQTEAAVKSFQQAQGITVDGVVGPETSGALRRRVAVLREKKRMAANRHGAK